MSPTSILLGSPEPLFYKNTISCDKTCGFLFRFLTGNQNRTNVAGLAAYVLPPLVTGVSQDGGHSPWALTPVPRGSEWGSGHRERPGDSAMVRGPCSVPGIVRGRRVRAIESPPGCLYRL